MCVRQNIIRLLCFLLCYTRIRGTPVSKLSELPFSFKILRETNCRWSIFKISWTVSFIHASTWIYNMYVYYYSSISYLLCCDILIATSSSSNDDCWRCVSCSSWLQQRRTSNSRDDFLELGTSIVSFNNILSLFLDYFIGFWVMCLQFVYIFYLFI